MVKPQIVCEVRKIEDKAINYYEAEKAGLSLQINDISSDELKTIYRVTIKNTSAKDFEGVIHLKIKANLEDAKFFMPGYMYNRNTAEMPSSGRKAFPRIRKDVWDFAESPFFMTRSDRLAEPVSLMYGNGQVLGVSAAPYIKGREAGESVEESTQFCGFTCHVDDDGAASVGYTIGYENAPWLFVQTATVLDRKPITAENAFVLASGEEYTFELTVYSYNAQDERDVYRAIEDIYWKYHEEPRRIPGMNPEKALELLSAAVRDYAWLPEERMYSGFVYDKPEGFTYNRIPSIAWTNGMAVAVPMLLAANRMGDAEARAQSLTLIEDVVQNDRNEASGFLYEVKENGKHTVRGWWYTGMHSGGHSSYINGQAVYYLIKAYENEKKKQHCVHENWLTLAGKIVDRMNEVINADYEYPFAMSAKTGVGIEYDSMGGAWFLAASAYYVLASGDSKWLETLRKSEAHYYEEFVKKVECYGGPLDTDKAVDNEGILAYIRAVRILHEMTGEEYLLNHLRDAFYYEFTFKLGYNTPIQVAPLSTIGWSSCGGSITSTANPHIHPMSSSVIEEMGYYLSFCEDSYIRSRMEDTIGWSLQTFNSKDGEYGYGKIGWMSERFCFCEGLLTEQYPDGSPASTWFALMPWASACILEGLCDIQD